MSFLDTLFQRTIGDRVQGLRSSLKRFTDKEPFSFLRPREPQPTPTPTPQPTPTPTPSVPSIPSGTNLALDYIRSKTPPGVTENQAFPVLGNQQFMTQVGESDKLKQGLSNLLLLQAFFESTMGRTTPNIFGVKPGGESKYFESPTAALEYQLGPNVLGGGANPNMNILQNDQPLTIEDITKLYSAYNPESYYLDNLLSILSGKI